MATSLPFEAHLAELAASGAAFGERAGATAADVRVPSCPAWTVAELVAHQGMVHRWATAHLRGGDLSGVPNQTDVLSSVPDLLSWYRDGLQLLLQTLNEVPDDIKAMTFLRDAPPPRRFWARRQAHETSVHAVDALAARLGRLPTAPEAGIGTAFALDGIDELVSGFLPRSKHSPLSSDEPFTIVIRPTDADRAWTLRVAEGAVVTRPGSAENADCTFIGTAAQLYLGVWNRGDEITTDGRPGALELWRAKQRVSW
ncbi:MAG: maleylpyruvate isomerase family mycothiol-dependent enzyme [Actinomycetota bacterium]